MLVWSRVEVDFPPEDEKDRSFDVSPLILFLILDRSRDLVNSDGITTEAVAYFLGRLFHIHDVAISKPTSTRYCICDRAGKGANKYKILLDKLGLLLYL